MAQIFISDSLSSLSKYISLEAHYELLKSIRNDIPVEDLRRQFDHGVFTTARKRYFLESNGLVRRDRLVDLIHEEGKFNARVKMAMYFLFLMRDSRYRDFICSEVADERGLWRDQVFQTERDDLFPQAGGRKAFTNLRQMLVHAGLLSPVFKIQKFPSLQSWFPIGIQIAAQHITDTETRQTFLSAPAAVLFRHKIHGILNAAPEDMLQVETIAIDEESLDLLPSYPLGSSQDKITHSDLKPWKPWVSAGRDARDARPFITNPVLLERANRQHRLLEEMMWNACRRSKCDVTYDQYIDMLATGESRPVVFEMKSCTVNSTRAQVRRAVGQLLEYAYLHRDFVENPVLCVVLERRPHEWQMSFVESLGIAIVWKADQGDLFVCSEQTKRILEPNLPAASEWQLP